MIFFKKLQIRLFEYFEKRYKRRQENLKKLDKRVEELRQRRIERDRRVYDKGYYKSKGFYISLLILLIFSVGMGLLGRWLSGLL